MRALARATLDFSGKAGGRKGKRHKSLHNFVCMRMRQPLPRHFIATAPKTVTISKAGLAVTSKGNGAPWGFSGAQCN